MAVYTTQRSLGLGVPDVPHKVDADKHSWHKKMRGDRLVLTDFAFRTLL